MKRNLLLLIMICMSASTLVAQQEVGINISRTFFLGDVSGYSNTPVFKKMQFNEWHTSIGFYHRLYFNNYVNMKTSMNFGRLGANDAYVEAGEQGSESWVRHYRNLHFRTNIYEFSLAAEFNVMRYEPASKTHRFSPYFSGGIGLVHFNPKAYYQGEWVDLQPLGTEGQGLDNTIYDAKYSKLSIQIPLGIGLKYNVTQSIALGLEATYKFTLTDYLDDVSGEYVAYNEFNNTYLTSEAQMIYALSNRSVEVDPDGSEASYFAPGEQRGNPDNLDRYLYLGVNLSLNLDAFNAVRCPAWR